MEYGHITYIESDGVAKIVLNRPDKLNALASQSLEELSHALDHIRDGGAARALLLTGEGRAFCSGADLSSNGAGKGPTSTKELPDAGAGLERHYNPLILKLRDLPVPIVAAVNGVAAGGGCGLALSADIVIAARSAYFLQPFANIGLVPDVGATWLLPRLIGVARATAMMMLAERIPADQAAEWGMIYRVVDDAELGSVAQAIAAKLAAGPTVAYRLMRHAISSCQEVGLIEALAIERRNQMFAGRTGDHKEGVAAFREKRRATFRGE
jgi:2-(1,2-epoxy-1,2-dihydrophenyl)acetyl-CoA isomerase